MKQSGFILPSHVNPRSANIADEDVKQTSYYRSLMVTLATLPKLRFTLLSVALYLNAIIMFLLLIQASSSQESTTLVDDSLQRTNNSTNTNSLSSVTGNLFNENNIHSITNGVIGQITKLERSLMSSLSPSSTTKLRAKKKCLVQMDSRFSDEGVKASSRLAIMYAETFGYDYHFYKCRDTSEKPIAISNACSRQCSHILYIDTDAFIEEFKLDVLEYFVREFDHEVYVVAGMDFKGTIDQNDDPNKYYTNPNRYYSDFNNGEMMIDCHNAIDEHDEVKIERFGNFLRNWMRLSTELKEVRQRNLIYEK